MKKVLIFAVIAGFILSLTGLSLAVAPGKKLEFDGSKQGKAVFDGKAQQTKASSAMPVMPLSLR